MGLVRRRAEAGRIPPVDTLACLRRVSPRKVKNIGGGQVGMAKRSRSPDHLSYSRLVLHVWVCPVPADRRERVPLRYPTLGGQSDRLRSAEWGCRTPYSHGAPTQRAPPPNHGLSGG